MPAVAWVTVIIAVLILAGGVELLGEVDRVPDLLATTDATVHQVAVGATRYAGSVARLLPPKEA